MRMFVLAYQRGSYAVHATMRSFTQGNVEIEQATTAFSPGGQECGAGSYALRAQQPQGHRVDRLLRIVEFPESTRKCDYCSLILP